jgi:thioesterase domain-containing protein
LAVHLLVELEKTFGIRLPVTTLLRDTTVKGFAEAVRNVDGHASNLILNPDGEFEPLFLVHGWVGGVLQYRALAPHLDPRQPVIGLHPQELDLGRSLDTSIEGMAARAITLMRGLKPAGPYLIGGHSIGGMIAYEMARQLSEQGQESAIVLLIDTHVPRHGLRLVRQKVRWYREAFRDRPIRDRLTHGRKVIDYRVGRPLRRWVKGLPAESDDRTSFDSLARNDEANYTALGHFVAKPYDGRVVVARTADWTLKAGAEDLGWTSLVKGYLEIRLLPGSHFTLFDEPNVAVVGDFISSTLAELRNGSVPQTPAAGAQAGSPGDHR